MLMWSNHGDKRSCATSSTPQAMWGGVCVEEPGLTASDIASVIVARKPSRFHVAITRVPPGRRMRAHSSGPATGSQNMEPNVLVNASKAEPSNPVASPWVPSHVAPGACRCPIVRIREVGSMAVTQ